MASSNLEPKDAQPEKGKAPTQGENEDTKSNQFNVLNAKEGEIITNEANLAEDISEHQDPLTRNNIPSSSSREDRIDTTMGDSSMPGGSWAERVKQSRVSSFASPDSSSIGSQETLETTPNIGGIKSQRYRREQEAERELELRRQWSIEETNLLQNYKKIGKADGRSRLGPQSTKK